MKYLKNFESITYKGHEFISDLFIMSIADQFYLKNVSLEEFDEIYDNIKGINFHKIKHTLDACYTEEFLKNYDFIRYKILMHCEEKYFKDSPKYKYLINFKDRLDRLYSDYNVRIKDYNFIGTSGKKTKDWVHITIIIENKDNYETH